MCSTKNDSKLLELYLRLQQIPIEIQEILSVYLIFDYTSKGLSKETIGNLLNISEREVQRELETHSNFSGFEKTLDKSPIVWYNSHSEEEFIQEFSEEIYDFLLTFQNMRKELDGYERTFA